MYALISENAVVGFCEKPNYVYYRPIMRAYYSTDDVEKADGIEFAGQLYNFVGSTKIKDVPEVELVYRDGMQVVFNQQSRLVINEGNTASIEEAVMDMDATNEDRFTVLEDAIIELDNAIING